MKLLLTELKITFIKFELESYKNTSDVLVNVT